MKYEMLAFEKATGSVLVRYWTDEYQQGLFYNVDIPIVDGNYVGMDALHDRIMLMAPYGQIQRIVDTAKLPDPMLPIVTVPVAPTVPTTSAPSEVTRFQALAALMQAGLLVDVEAYMSADTTDSFTKLAWKEAATFSRGSLLVSGVGTLLGLTDVQVDDLFIFANSISA